VPGAQFDNSSGLAGAVGFDIHRQLPRGRWTWVVMNGGAAAGSAGASPAPPATDPLLAEVADPRAFADDVRAHRLAWGGMLVVQVAGEGRAVIERLVARPEYEKVKLIVAVSGDVPLDDDTMLLWGIFTRFDCARDIVPANVETRGAWLTCRGPLGIDATWKQGYPDPVENLPEVVSAVDGWWK
jgi:3-polyprenyl-4-hydroxybenzoate decarboxylase